MLRLLYIASFVSVLVLSSIYPTKVFSDLGCTATISPNQVSPDSLVNFDLNIDNTGDEDIVWIKVTRPSANFNIQNSDISGWNGSTPSDDYTIQNDGSLFVGESLVMSVTALTSGTQTGPSDWLVETSNSFDGSNPMNCSGSLATEISGSAPDVTPPNISNISVSDIRTTSVVISWNTDEPATSQIDYDENEQYHNTSSNQTLKMSHSLRLNNLTPNTAYHYQIAGKDANGNEAHSADNTFITTLVDPIPEVSEGNTVTPTGEVLKTKIPIKAVPTEKIPPEISLTTSFDVPYKESPEILGVAKDNEALAGIDYSTDGGKNWLQVDRDKGLGTTQANFSFKPLNLDDGNYQIVVRAIDTSGNIGLSSQKVLVIDRLPPQVGGSAISSGPQIFQPNDDGVIYSLVGVDQKITTSAIGGPTSILITAKKNGNSSKLKTFSLTKSADTGLWSGIISFQEQGDYTLIADSLDGAGNRTSKVIGLVQALAPARVTNDKKSLQGAKVTLYYLEPSTNLWTVWDGESYGQSNPQITNENGQFNLYVPEGKYYLKSDSKNYRTLISNVFEIKGSMPILTNLKMKEAVNIEIGKLSLHIPPFSNDTVDITPPKLSKTLPPAGKNLINKQSPEFVLKDLRGRSVKSTDLTGRPTIITFLSSWSPPSREQLAVLSKLQQNKDINVIPVVIHENSGKINSILKISGIELEVLTDPDGVMVDKYGVQTLPSHYVFDRRGVVKSVTVGVLSEDKINNALSGGR